MPRQNSSKQIAAHFTQTYIEDGRDADVLHEFSQVLETELNKISHPKEARQPAAQPQQAQL